MPRALSLALIGLVLAGVALDPYTWYHDASDLVVPGPWWQTLLGLVDVSLLVASLVMVWRRRYDRGFLLLAVEALWAIGAALILMHRDGGARFIRGFGAQPYIMEYLILYGVRVAGMGCLWLAAWRTTPPPSR